MFEREDVTYYFAENDKRRVEKFVGIEAYANSKIEGIGGEYKKTYKDFIVKEITSNGKILEIKEDLKNQAFSKESNEKYTTFNLIKINKDNFEAIREISEALKIPLGSIHYSGLKDKCSISVQKLSIKGDFIEKLKNLKLKDLHFRNISPSKKYVKLASHWGNHFSIVIRNIENKENLKNQIEEISNFLTKFGFPNYFGLQRFGTFRPNSHLIGRYLLENDFEKVFNEFVIFTYSTESFESKQARKALEDDNNFKKAYQNFPKSLFYERSMIKHLIEKPGDYEGCIATLPFDLKKLLLSSFQSYLFNKMISLRCQKGFSLFEPLKGDVISILDDDNGNVTQVTYVYGGYYDDYLKRALKLNRAVIIIPIVGFDTDMDEFPLMKTFYNEVLEQDKIDENIFKNKFLKETEFKGSIRAMTVKPTGLRLLGLKDDEFYQNKKKVKIEFSIQKGTYATMLLREIIK
ncbi:MAG: tRNA pseudouridine(13) synthase TruD [Promethearchaeota archaeon]